MIVAAVIALAVSVLLTFYVEWRLWALRPLPINLMRVLVVSAMGQAFALGHFASVVFQR